MTHPLRKKNLFFWLLAFMLPAISSLLSACSKDSDDDPQPKVELKTTIFSKSPVLPIELFAQYNEGNVGNPQFTSYKKSDTPRYTVWAKQKGQLYYFGDIEATIVSSDNSEARLDLDFSEKLNPSEPFDVYTASCAWHRDDNELFFKTDMSRGGSFWVYSKISNPGSKAEVTETMANTCEILFIINKSGKPIKFRHKGFNAEKKWYYNYAEVSMDDGRVVDSKMGEEVISDIVDVPAYDGKKAHRFYSYYVPNGQKIQNAQLIAEIDGKEVRSENRISSDLTLQLNHCYGMFAIWDGEKLMMGDDNGNPVVHVCSGDNSGEINVKEVREDGTVVMTVPSEDLPKVGEIIVSGISEAAPKGFIYKVKQIIDNNGSYEIKTEPAALDEVFHDVSCEIPIPLGQSVTARITGADGKSHPVNVRRASHDADILSIDWKGMVCALPELSGTPSFILLDEKESDSFDFSRKSAVGITYDLSGKISATFVLETHEDQDKRIGLKGELELSATLGATAALKEKYDFGKYKIADIELSPIEFVIPVMGVPVPIVITPVISLYIELSATGEVYISAKLLSYKAGGSLDYCYYFDGHPLTGENNVLNHDWSWGPIEDITDIKKAGGDLIKGDNLKIGLKGSLKANFDIEANFGLYNSNENACIALEVSPFIRLNGNVVYTFSYNKDEEDLEGFPSDEFSLDGGIDGKISGRVKLFGEERELGKEFEIFSTSLWKPFGFTMHFDDFNVEKSDDNKKLYVRCQVTKPFIQFLQENDYGYCYGTDPKNKKQWTFISLKDKYDLIIDPLLEQSQEMQYLMDITNLKPQTKYFIRPYVTYFGTTLYPTGGSFETVSDNAVIIPIIPGEDL